MSTRHRMSRTQLVMELTARRIETTGLHQGATLNEKDWASYPPATYAPDAPCSVLHAFERAQRLAAGRTIRAGARRHGQVTVRPRAYHPAEFSEALRVLSDHLSDVPITPDLYRPLGLSEADYRLTVLSSWGESEGLTAAAAARTIRAAAPARR
ncbi:DUF6197 family protein [Kitasatospora sp. NPDC127060]|uniref:DUF6197 family protein n=1 Tax=Kitasatospora sp. NPDC127060 TaxID=3347121 RepID=UPI0036471F88